MIRGKGVRESVRTGAEGPFIVLLSFVVLLFAAASCGRRGDPVMPPSYEEKTPQEGEKGDLAPAGTLPGSEVPGAAESEMSTPVAPGGLVAVFTGKSIVLTWNELLHQGVRRYRIYRSSGNGYDVVAETVTTAYTDRNVKEATAYYYRISAVGETEGPLSEEIKISTEIK